MEENNIAMTRWKALPDPEVSMRATQRQNLTAAKKHRILQESKQCKVLRLGVLMPN